MKKFISEEGQVSILDDRFYLLPQYREMVKNEEIDFFDLPNEAFVPSVTTQLQAMADSIGLAQWKKEMGSQSDIYMNERAEIGTNVHNALEEYAKMKKGEKLEWFRDNDLSKPIFTHEEWSLINRGIEFLDRHKPKIVAVEQVIASEKYQCGGTMDLVCEIDGELWLIDYKTSKQCYDSHKMQLAIYIRMWNELNPGNEIKRAGCLILNTSHRGPDKTGKKMQGRGWQLVELEEMEYYGVLYLHTAQMWKHMNPKAYPKNFQIQNTITKQF